MDKFYLVKTNVIGSGYDLFSEDEYINLVKDFFKRAKEKKGCHFYDSDEESYYVFAEGVLYDLKNASVINSDQYTFLVKELGKHCGSTRYSLYDKKDDNFSDYCPPCWHSYKDEELAELTLKDFGIEGD